MKTKYDDYLEKVKEQLELTEQIKYDLNSVLSNDVDQFFLSKGFKKVRVDKTFLWLQSPITNRYLYGQGVYRKKFLIRVGTCTHFEGNTPLQWDFTKETLDEFYNRHLKYFTNENKKI